MRIINPSFGQSAAGGEQLATEPTDWLKDSIALIGNAKPNAKQLLEGVKQGLAAFRPIDNIDYVYKDSASQPAPAELIEQVAANYRGAILAIAD
jgi:hypothetical protein